MTRVLRLGLLLLAGVPVLVAAQRPASESLDTLVARAARDSNDATTHYALAMGYWQRKKWDEAERALRTAILVAPSYAEAYLALGILPMVRGERYWKDRAKRDGPAALSAAFTEAELFYRRAFQFNPLVDLSILGKAQEAGPDIISRPGGFAIRIRPFWEREFLKALNEFQEVRYDAAFNRLNALVTRPEWGGAYENVASPVLWFHGLAAAHLGQYEVAVHDFAVLTGRAYATEEEAAAEGIPLATNDFRYLLATMLYLAGRHDQAIPVFQRALEFDIGLYAAHVQLARIHEAAGRLEEALRERQRAVDVNAEQADPRVDMATTLLRLGRNAEALEALTLAEGMNRRDARIPYLRGVVAFHVGDSAQGRAAFERFLAIAPSRMAEQVAEVRARLGAP